MQYTFKVKNRFKIRFKNMQYYELPQGVYWVSTNSIKYNVLRDKITLAQNTVGGTNGAYINYTVTAENSLIYPWRSLPTDSNRSTLTWHDIQQYHHVWGTGSETYLGQKIGKSNGWHHGVQVACLISHDHMEAWALSAETLPYAH